MRPARKRQTELGDSEALKEKRLEPRDFEIKMLLTRSVVESDAATLLH